MEILAYFLCLIMGLILGLLGGGGSILTVPILVYFLDIPASLATGYSLFIVGTTSLIAALRYHQERLLDYKTATVFAIPSILGVLLARIYILPQVPAEIQIFHRSLSKDQLILLIFALMVLLISFFMFKSKNEKKTETQEKSNKENDTRLNYFLISIEGLCVGVATGFVGAGGGFMIVPALVLLAKIPLRKAIATSLLIISAKSLIGFAGDWWAGIHYNYTFLASILSLTLLGSLLGTFINQKIAAHQLRKAFAVFVLIMGLFIFAKEINTFTIERSTSVQNTQNLENKSITAMEFIQNYAGNPEIQIIDVREPEEFEAGHIPAAKLIPLGQLENNLAALNKNKTLILYCRSGRRSGIAQESLKPFGFHKTLNLAGGILAWNEALKKEEKQ